MTVKITVNDKPSNVIKTVINHYLEQGIHSVQLDFGNFKSGTYRVYFTAQTNSGQHYTSYGDIFFTKIEE